MWGNRNGWLISVAIVAVMGFLLYVVARPPAPTPPSGAAVISVAQKPIALPVSPASVLAPGTEDCDAATLYREAIKKYESDPRPYERFHGRGGVQKVTREEMPAIEDVVKATHCGKKFSLFAAKPGELVNYDNDEPSLYAINDIGNIACTVGRLNFLDKKYDDAKKLWEAAFALGVRLHGERVSWAEMADGHGLMQTAATNLRDLAQEQGDRERRDTVETFMSGEGQYQTKLTEAFKIIGAIDEGYAGPYAGDIFAIAGNPKADPMWRVEAFKHIGHYKYNARSKGDQLTAKKVLATAGMDPSLDPSVKTAALAAHDLTPEKHNMVGGSTQ
ncbi:MAG: hypothetical protein JWN51_1905 [Phycisphaerales bacterium]|jgi:hypothetical protein|nr:hypothetical protein [Phycisphaerales bacterium]